MSSVAAATRALTAEERSLAAHMLAHSANASQAHHEQLATASANIWRCDCGCASYNLVVPGTDPPNGGMQVLGDFVFGEGPTLAGAFIFAQAGVLAGVEIYGLAGDAPGKLPEPLDLRPFHEPP